MNACCSRDQISTWGIALCLTRLSGYWSGQLASLGFSSVSCWLSCSIPELLDFPQKTISLIYNSATSPELCLAQVMWSNFVFCYWFQRIPAIHLELNSVSSSKSKGCSIQYLFRKELETLIFTNTFIGFSKHRIKWFTSSSVVTGCICRDCKCSYIHLEITYVEFWLINLP